MNQIRIRSKIQVKWLRLWFPPTEMTGKYESEETSGKWKYRWNFFAGSCWDLSFLPRFQVFSSLSTSMGCASFPTSRLCHAITMYLCLISTYSPRLLLLSSLTTIQGSFPCSNRVITSGLEMEHPAWKNIMVHNKKKRINLIEPSEQRRVMGLKNIQDHKE